jgi:hypothetical protein
MEIPKDIKFKEFMDYLYELSSMGFEIHFKGKNGQLFVVLEKQIN